ncbi:GNAT family N-acetyltransferase [Psychrobacillus sp. OK032]|uniref:GNAT family N-acetyltransferase n=1 Tax=Psychrobacillus sp. OK032 TaxID=1884358 RepID=UPI0008B3B36A|nr:GNAT family N-acetyltransferase [Psychrobacillus sp. OK032]SES12316.1 Ribosomal protein S18 acetylase RimI [Psychrobacillus sp. OK032]
MKKEVNEVQEINTSVLPFSIRELLAYAISVNKIDAEYELYKQLENRKLYGYKQNEKFIGCIGIELTEQQGCEIKQIAVSPFERGAGIGKRMINFIMLKHSLSLISAETDQDAVSFYKRIGFCVTSIGEKYPGVERFWCECLITEKVK